MNDQSKQKLLMARAQATNARGRGLVWRLTFDDHLIDVSVLAFCEEVAAVRWISKTLRSFSRTQAFTEDDCSRLRKALWDFWRGGVCLHLERGGA